MARLTRSDGPVVESSVIRQDLYVTYRFVEPVADGTLNDTSSGSGRGDLATFPSCGCKL